MADTEQPLARLERATEALLRADLDDLPAFEAALGRREDALRDLLSRNDPSPELAARLTRVAEAGREVEKKLRLRRVALRARLAENHNARILLRAFSAPEFETQRHPGARLTA
jgi:hypothetical protein